MKRLAAMAFVIAAVAVSATAQTTVTTSGTTSSGTVPVFNGTATVTNSPITVSGSNVGIGTTSPRAQLDVEGGILQSTFSNRQVLTAAVGQTNTENSIVFTFPAGIGEAGFAKVVFNIYSGYVGIAGSRQTAVVEVAYSQNMVNTVSITPLDFRVYGHGELSLNAGYSIGANIFSLDFTNLAAPGGTINVEATIEIDSDQLGIPSVSLSSTPAGTFTAIPNKFSSNDGNYITSGYVGIGTTSPASLLSVGPSSQFQVNSSGGVSSGPITSSGPVGIGVSPQYTLDVAGQIHASQAIYASGGITFADGSSLSSANTLCGGDYAESVNVSGDRPKFEPGDVLVIDPNVSGKFLKSSEPYSTSVTGIYSTKPGAIGRRQSGPKSADEVPMAMIGIVPTKVSAENGPIHRGDLLVTSSTIGYAMKGTDRSRLTGAVIGKALDNLESGKGVIEVVVTLQ